MRHFKKIAAATVAGLMVMLGVIALPQGASAHVPTASATCSTLSVALTSYNNRDENTVSVLIDGAVIVDKKSFGTSYDKDFSFSDQYVSHTWKVIVRTDADPDGARGWSKNLTGTSTPCDAPDTSDKKIKFCHATSSETNPYNLIETSVFAFYNGGHIDHAGDIYPAGSFEKGNKTFSWEAQGDLSLLQYEDCVKPVIFVVPNNPVVKDKCGVVDDHYGLPEGPAGIAYSRSGKDIIATLTGEAKFGTLPTGWVLNENGTATYAFSNTAWDQTPCPVEDAFASWGITEPTCTDRDGSGFLAYTNAKLVSATLNGDDYPNLGGFPQGNHPNPAPSGGVWTLTFEADTGHLFSGGKSTLTIEFAVPDYLTDVDCPTPVPVLFNVDPDPATCLADGQAPLLDALEELYPNVDFSVDPAFDGPGIYVITVTPNEGYFFVEADVLVPWTYNEDGSISREVTVPERLVTDPVTGLPCNTAELIEVEPGFTIYDACGTAGDLVIPTEVAGIASYEFATNDDQWLLIANPEDGYKVVAPEGSLWVETSNNRAFYDLETVVFTDEPCPTESPTPPPTQEPSPTPEPSLPPAPTEPPVTEEPTPTESETPVPPSPERRALAATGSSMALPVIVAVVLLGAGAALLLARRRKI